MGSAPPATTIYCHKCGYALVGLSENRCPECGRGFEPTDRRTFDVSVRRWQIRRWVRRAALGIGCLAAVCLLVVATVLGNLYWHWRAEQPLIAAIRQRGGNPSFVELPNPSDARLFYGLFSPSLPLHECPWIQQVFLNLSRRVGSVEYTNISLTQEDISVLAELPWLYGVDFVGTRLDGNALAPLQQAPRLGRLRLTNMSLSRDDLECIGRMRGLYSLTFREVSLDGPDLVCLRHLPALRDLSVIQADAIDDSALEHIGKITTLQGLLVIRPRITDGGLRHLSGLRRLEVLALDSAQITGSGLVHLKGLPVLAEVYLSGCNIVDDGLASLKDWPSLKRLGLDETLITDAAAKHLAAAQTLTRVNISKTQMHDACQWLRSTKPDLVVYGYDERGQPAPGLSSQPTATQPSDPE